MVCLEAYGCCEMLHTRTSQGHSGRARSALLGKDRSAALQHSASGRRRFHHLRQFCVAEKLVDFSKTKIQVGVVMAARETGSNRSRAQRKQARLHPFNGACGGAASKVWSRGTSSLPEHFPDQMINLSWYIVQMLETTQSSVATKLDRV
jgi:hypothetical protein